MKVKAFAKTIMAPLEDGKFYIIAHDGTESLSTVEMLWTFSYTIGDSSLWFET